MRQSQKPLLRDAAIRALFRKAKKMEHEAADIERKADAAAEAWAIRTCPFKLGDLIRYPVKDRNHGRLCRVLGIDGNGSQSLLWWRANVRFVKKDGSLIYRHGHHWFRDYQYTDYIASAKK